jgi:hypothetical protein
VNDSEVAAPKQLERSAIVSWRFQALLRAGYSWDAATRLAVSPEVDLHVALELLERDCPEPTALKILL